MNLDSEIRIILDSSGIQKIELFCHQNDLESEEAALKTYGKLALVIHQFGAKAKAILSKTTAKK
jgi:hypothetical protein